MVETIGRDIAETLAVVHRGLWEGNGFVVKHEQAVDGHRRKRVGPAVAVREFHLKHVAPEHSDDRADLASCQTMLRQIGGQGDDVEEAD